jgi:hypothetical protein
MGIRFRVLACPIDASTGDRRRFAADALTHQPLPMPLGWVRSDGEGHDGAVTVGTITDVEMSGTDVWVTGEVFDESDPGITASILEDAKSALFLARQGVVGPSVDLDDFDAMPVRAGTDAPISLDDLEDDETDVELLVTRGRMRSATLVRIPAFVETNHSMEFLDERPEAITASLAGDTELPVVDDREHEWDGSGAAQRVFDAYSAEDGSVDRERAARAFLWVDGDGTLRGDYRLGFADLVDGELRIIPRGVAATAGGRGVDATDLPEEDKNAIKSRICSLYETVRGKFEDWPECPFDREDESADMEEASAITATVGTVFDSALFVPPVTPDRPIPIRYDYERGQVYGHIAPWGVCHEGIKGACVLAPRAGEGNYRDFHVHRVETDARTVYAGRITLGGDHASRDGSLQASQVRQVYDQKETIAYVVASEDEHGIFVCGPLVTDKPVPQVTIPTPAGIVREHAVSGDWRETVNGLSLIEVLALEPGPPESSRPGFPIPRMRVGFAAGRQVALTASLMPPTVVEAPDSAEVFRATAERLVREELAKATSAQSTRVALEREISASHWRELRDLIGRAV